MADDSDSRKSFDSAVRGTCSVHSGHSNMRKHKPIMGVAGKEISRNDVTRRIRKMRVDEKFSENQQQYDYHMRQDPQMHGPPESNEFAFPEEEAASIVHSEIEDLPPLVEDHYNLFEKYIEPNRERSGATDRDKLKINAAQTEKETSKGKIKMKKKTKNFL